MQEGDRNFPHTIVSGIPKEQLILTYSVAMLNTQLLQMALRMLSSHWAAFETFSFLLLLQI